MINAADKKQKPYQKKLLAFIDILRFGELVAQSRGNPGRIKILYDSLRTSSDLLQSFRSIRPTILNVDPSEWITHMFSDTITLSSPYRSHDDLVAIAAAVMIYQYTMWTEQGVFVREAIVYDDIYEEEIVFGPAVVSAYHLEREAAIWPLTRYAVR